MEWTKWVCKETFNELDVPPRLEVMNLFELDRYWINQELPISEYIHLYEYFIYCDGQILHSVNSKGELELMVCLEDEDLIAIEECHALGLEVERTELEHYQVNLLHWDQPDHPPFITPFIFNLTQETERYAAVAFAEQEKLPLYLLRKEKERLIVWKSKALTWSKEIREMLREGVREAYLDEKKKEGLSEVLAEELSDKELSASGWAYQFDEQTLISAYGSEENAGAYIAERTISALQLLSEHRNSGIRKGPFLVWMKEKTGLYGATGEQQKGIIVFISPFYHDRARGRKTDHEPCIDHFMLQRVTVTERFVFRAAQLYDQMAARYKELCQQDLSDFNYYRYLLE